MTDDRYQAAYTKLLNGDIELERCNYSEAIKLFRSGIATLGTHYHYPQIIENTGMRLILADMEEGQQRLLSAAKCLKEALDSRLYIYQKKLASPAVQAALKSS